MAIAKSKVDWLGSQYSSRCHVKLYVHTFTFFERLAVSVGLIH